MFAMTATPEATLDPAQAAELALLVDLEASWENLRKPPSQSGGRPTLQELHAKQKSYEVFRGKLAAYNKRYAPAHVPELLLNTPIRLGIWCQRMRDLFLLVERNPPGHCPAHLIEKAYRWADRVAVRLGQPPIQRSTPPDSIQAAIRDLEAIGQWCAERANGGLPAATRDCSSGAA